MVGEGVHDIYKERAHKGGDVLWHVTIKGQNELAAGIPLHMSLKVFEDKKDMNLNEIKEKIKELNIKKPDPKKLKFKTTIFTSERDQKKYYMLLIDGTDENYAKFYDVMKHCGTVYKKFMPHITIDKGLYDKINEEGLKPEEIQFDELTIESGAGNTVHEFKKSFEESALKLIRENALFVEDLKNSLVFSLPDNMFKNWLLDNPEKHDAILQKSEERISFHFGENETLIEFARENGISKTYELLRKK